LKYFNDVQRLLNGRSSVKREPCINFRRHLARDDLQDLLSELHKQSIEGSLDLLVKAAADLLALLNRSVNQLRVVGLLGGSEDEGWVGGGILRLVLCDGCKVTGVADDRLAEEVLLVVCSDSSCSTRVRMEGYFRRRLQCQWLSIDLGSWT